MPEKKNPMWTRPYQLYGKHSKEGARIGSAQTASLLALIS